MAKGSLTEQETS